MGGFTAERLCCVFCHPAHCSEEPRGCKWSNGISFIWGRTCVTVM